ncbi:MAG: hypothetical protein FJY19_03235 [Bacteroidetes bacterium]|nr:hypothetical protein [Bacteroidota bacterium]
MPTIFRIVIFLLFLGFAFSDAIAQPGNGAFQVPADYKPEFRRERNHELIQLEQRLIMDGDGSKDNRFTPGEHEALNTALTHALLQEVNRMAYQIETDPVFDHRLKVNYLVGLESLLKFFREHWKRNGIEGVNPQYLSLLIANYEACVTNDKNGISIAPLVTRLPYDVGNNLLAAGIFEKNPGYQICRENLLLKYCTLLPERTFFVLQKNPDVQFADSLIKAVARKFSYQLYDYAAAGDRLGQRIRAIQDDAFVVLIARMSQSKSGQQYFPFVDHILQGKTTLEQIDAVKEDTLGYYRLLVATQQDYVKRAIRGDTAMEAKALARRLEDKARSQFVTVINGLHNEKDLQVRFKIIQSLSAAELYYLAVLSDGTIYTSSFVRGIYPLMMLRIGNRGDSLLKEVRFDRYRKFIKMAAAFNTLDNFLASFPASSNNSIEDPANTLMRAFVKNLDKTDGLEDGADVADSYASIAENLPHVASRMLENIRENQQEAVRQGSRKGVVIYSILEKLFLSADSTQTIDLTKELGIPPVYKVPFKDLADDSGVVHVQLFIYGDKDGIVVFPGLVKMFNNSNWKIDPSNKYWVKIKSAKGKPVTLYLNRPLPEEQNEDAQAQKELNNYLQQQGITPRITINRGHSYNAPYTIAQMSPASKIVFMGSCGGYNMIHDILVKAPDAHIIGTKQIADAPVNNPFLRLLMEKLRTGNDIEWIGFWKELDHIVTDKIFEDYVPPHKNLGALFIKAYTKAM